ncbi:MAG: hypothetical protein M3380_13475 [Chloroflexota bacterium]|nr:hypothetical protein [Chloroflexota bacterium]
MLTLLAPALLELRPWLLRYWCHRTGQWQARVRTPLYRLRAALSRLWLAHLGSPYAVPWQNSG